MMLLDTKSTFGLSDPSIAQVSAKPVLTRWAGQLNMELNALKTYTVKCLDGWVSPILAKALLRNREELAFQGLLRFGRVVTSYTQVLEALDKADISVDLQEFRGDV